MFGCDYAIGFGCDYAIGVHSFQQLCKNNKETYICYNTTHIAAFSTSMNATLNGFLYIVSMVRWTWRSHFPFQVFAWSRLSALQIYTKQMFGQLWDMWHVRLVCNWNNYKTISIWIWVLIDSQGKEWDHESVCECCCKPCEAWGIDCSWRKRQQGWSDGRYVMLVVWSVTCVYCILYITV